MCRKKPLPVEAPRYGMTSHTKTRQAACLSSRGLPLFGRDRTLIRSGVLSRQEKPTIPRIHGRDRTEQAAAILSRQRFRQRLCVARSAAFQHGPKTVTQYDDYERITTFFLSPSEQKEGFRQTGARRHAFGEVMRKVSVRQLPKSAYGAQLHEIYR